MGCKCNSPKEDNTEISSERLKQLGKNNSLSLQLFDNRKYI